MDDQPRSLSVHVPLTFLLLALSVFFASQIGAANRSTSTIKWQLENYEKQINQLTEGEKSMKDQIEKNTALLDQSTKVQEQYTALLNDVLELAKADKDAQTIVEKWKIQRSTPAEGEKKTGDEKKQP
jgi:predicted  nucleic acid-binding Zn-ribbon protein